MLFSEVMSRPKIGLHEKSKKMDYLTQSIATAIGVSRNTNWIMTGNLLLIKKITMNDLALLHQCKVCSWWRNTNHRGNIRKYDLT